MAFRDDMMAEHEAMRRQVDKQIASLRRLQMWATIGFGFSLALFVAALVSWLGGCS